MDDYLGSGTSGEVKRIYSPQLRQVIAVKSVRLPTKRGTKEEALIMREAKIHRPLNHPNILPCFHYDVRATPTGGNKAEEPRILSLDLELMTDDVHDLVVSGAAAGTDLLHLADALLRQMLQALDHLATTARLVHRDVKPANMLYRRLDDDFVFKLADFGVAKPCKAPPPTA
ncbi:putative calcium calmodulin-dependent protein kinase [Diplodia seriata]|uniref:Putative calcium calmodulin-dependent protein kinase n=1 Tax=Diplodia seriata TaxID=420778 RepID=A0A0G2GPL8_9PEZI|nr:putative calcium calmodulin-dependent protein kinase [Diplodia seriata]